MVESCYTGWNCSLRQFVWAHDSKDKPINLRLAIAYKHAKSPGDIWGQKDNPYSEIHPNETAVHMAKTKQQHHQSPAMRFVNFTYKKPWMWLKVRQTDPSLVGAKENASSASFPGRA